MLKIIIGIIAIAAVVICGFMFIDPKVENPGFTTSLGSDSNTVSFPITLEGEIANPGTYSLSEGVTMAEAIQEAGGLTSNGDTLSFFEDVVLKKGHTYYIAGVYDNKDVCNTNPIKKVNINSDDANTLSSISAITATLANSIVSYREENGIFDTIEELMEVYGIGTATYSKVRNFVTLHEWFCF